jgi:hypothetical protein
MDAARGTSRGDPPGDLAERRVSGVRAPSTQLLGNVIESVDRGRE